MRGSASSDSTLSLLGQTSGVLVLEPLEEEIRTLHAVLGSDRDPDGRAFAPLADAYRRAGQPRKAFGLLTDGLARLPDFASGHVVAARLYAEQGLLAEGEIAARRALDLDPDNVIAMAALARVLRSSGKTEEAAETLATLSLLEPEVLGEEGLAEAEAPGGAMADDDQVDLANLTPGQPEPADPTAADGEGGHPAGWDEPVMELADLAPDEPVMDIAELTPDEPATNVTAVTPDEETTEQVLALAPDEPVIELADLAPDEPVMELADLAPDEAVMDLADLAPDEPVMELADLAPDEPVAEMAEAVMDLADLAPDEPVMELADLAPEPDQSVDDPSDLAPEPILEMSDLSPDPEPESAPEPDVLAPVGAVDSEVAVAASAESANPGGDRSGGGPPAPRIYTRTLAELYARQGFLDRAIEVFRQLRAEHPGDESLAERLGELEEQLSGGGNRPSNAASSGDAPDAERARERDEELESIARDLARQRSDEPDVDTPFAWTGSDEPEDDTDEPASRGPTIGSYFDELLSWQPKGQA